MKNIYLFLASILISSFGFGQQVIITGIVDGDLSGGNPKGIEVYIDGTVDLSNYSLWKSSNGGAFSNVGTLSGSYTDEFVYLTNNQSEFSSVFGASGDFANVIVDGDVSGNGDDGFQIRLVSTSAVIDQVWTDNTSDAYRDSYIYRNDNTGPDGSWIPANWTLAGNGALDGLDATQHASTVPFGSFSLGGGSSPTISFEGASSSENETNTTFNISIPVSMINYDMPVTVSVTVDAASTAEAGDYTLNTTSLSFTADETLNISLDINDDAGFDDESLILNLAVTSGTADLGTSQHTVTIFDNESAPSATLIAFQSFEGNDSWDYVANPSTFNDASAVWNEVDNTFRTFGTIPSDGTNFFGIRDLNSTNGTTGFGTLSFESLNISGLSNVVIKFDFEVDGFDSNDDMKYELFEDGVSQGEVVFVDGFSNLNSDGNIEISVSANVEIISLIVSVRQNGEIDYGALDNFRVEGIFNGLVYNGGVWSPMDPDGSTGASDAIVIDGTVTFAADASLNDVSVLPGAAIRVNSSVTLGTNTLNLKSTSTSYSNLIVDGTVTGTVSYSRYVNSNDPINGNDLISAPLSGQDFDVFFGNNPNILSNPSGSEVLFGGFDNDDALNPFELWDETDTTPLAAGQGYRTGIDTAASSNFVSFEGTVNSSDVSVPIDQGTASILNLVGNPFPSYLDAQAFLTENASLLEPTAQVIYGYNDSTNGTSSNDYTIISSLENTTLDIAPGQAFFVASNASVGNILEFTTSAPDMRITSDQDDFIANRNARPSTTNINISLTNASEDFITKIYFTPSSGLGLDPGYDASLIGGVAPEFALFSHLVEQNMNVPFATQALGKNDYNDTTVALGVNANIGEQLTFSIAQSTLPAEIEVYLDDTTANTSTLLTASDYIITPNANLNGTGRFYVRFSNSALSIPENNLDNITIYTNATNRTINISGQLEEGTIAKVYDIQGRLVQTDVLSSNARLHSIDGNALHAGVYIVELSHDNLKKSKKVILR